MADDFVSQGIVEDTRRGLLSDPKWLSSLYFYDDEGSRLFEAICETPEYYPTRTEHKILTRYSNEILSHADDAVLVELGSGASTKTEVLLAALLERPGRHIYHPIDVSGPHLEATAKRLRRRFQGLEVVPLVAEYLDGVRTCVEAERGPRLLLFLGSSIGNFEPDEQDALLAKVHACLEPGDMFLLGTDMVKEAQVLEAAYNDAAGVTARFNKNILRHVGRRLGGQIDLDSFDHVAFWNPQESRIEMHLASRRAQRLDLPRAELVVHLRAGERIHTENSYKFTPGRIKAMAATAGFDIVSKWSDEDGWFCLTLLRA